MKDSGMAVLDYGTYAFSIAPIPTAAKDANAKPAAATDVPYASCNDKAKTSADASALTDQISHACGDFASVKGVKPGDKALHFIDYSAKAPYAELYVQWVDGCKLPGGSQSQDPNLPLGGKCETLFANVFDVCEYTPDLGLRPMQQLTFTTPGSANGDGNNGAGGAIQVGCLEYKGSLTTAAPSEPSESCMALFHGSNSYGGGGPGQAPIDENAWGVTISGKGKAWQKDLEQNGPNGLMTLNVTGSDFGGKSDISLDAQWEFGGNVWYHCRISENGKEYTGQRQKEHIASDIVSVTTDDCEVEFPC